jgi:hypothetical protein
MMAWGEPAELGELSTLDWIMQETMHCQQRSVNVLFASFKRKTFRDSEGVSSSPPPAPSSPPPSFHLPPLPSPPIPPV